MAFTSYEFIVFFTVLLLIYWLVRRRDWQNIVLLVSSAVFYGWLAAWHVAVLFLSLTIDYFLALGMLRWREKAGRLLWLGIVANLGLLGIVKYDLFSNQVLASWFSRIGLSGDLFSSRILLPLGLSFYLLKKIGYLIDVRRGVLAPTRDWVAFAAYVSFFPQVFSGPIDRPQILLKQLEGVRAWKAEHLINAWPLLVMGCFKKIVVADSVTVVVDHVFAMNRPSGFLLLSASLGFTLQILADFSAYTDLARGTARLLGLETSENFKLPYLSLTPTEFWNRWHITLSTWLRDYIFFPVRRALLKSRLKQSEFLVLAIPPILTMLVSGLWHGVGWTFPVWGLYYGILIASYQLIGIRGDWVPRAKGARFLAWLVMIGWITLGWVIFRAPSLGWLGGSLFHTPFIGSRDDWIGGLTALSVTFYYSLPLILKWLIDRYSRQDVAQFLPGSICLLPESEPLHFAFLPFVLALGFVVSMS
jgi:D-alanyl-lipoteichoic acid acyltransferase DltB (MBOAT superfamily)